MLPLARTRGLAATGAGAPASSPARAAARGAAGTRWMAVTTQPVRVPAARTPRRRLLATEAEAAAGAARPRQAQAEARAEAERSELSTIFMAEPPPQTPVQRGATAAMWLGVAALVSVSGFYIVREIVPLGMSPNAVFNDSFERVRNHNEVVARLGTPVKAYGKGASDGRRNWIDHDEYVDDDGAKRTRVKYNVEGPNGKAVVYAEKVKGAEGFSYVILEHATRARHDAIALEDNRKQVSREELQDKVTKRLAKAGAVLYGHARDPWTHRQREELGEFADRVKFLACDRPENADDCAKAQLKNYPTWRVQDQNLPGGFKTLEELQSLARLL